jgi:hypothetical protein
MSNHERMAASGITGGGAERPNRAQSGRGVAARGLALPIGNDYLRLHRKGDLTYAPRRDLHACFD